MIEDIKGKGVGFFAVCAEPQAPVDQIMNEYNLGFTVSIIISSERPSHAVVQILLLVL